MGGGHLSRPDFGMPQPDPDHPLTEFYLLLQHGLDKAGVFPVYLRSMPASGHRPGIYADEAAGCLTLSETADEGAVLLSAPRNLQLLYSSLHVEPDGSPAALLLTEECSRAVCAVQLLLLCLGGPAAAPAGCPGRSDPAIDPAGCGGHRHRPCRPCPPPVPDHPAEALAGPHPKADLYLAENCPFPKALSLMQ